MFYCVSKSKAQDFLGSITLKFPHIVRFFGVEKCVSMVSKCASMEVLFSTFHYRLYSNRIKQKEIDTGKV